jgi:hypothetical protein
LFAKSKSLGRAIDGIGKLFGGIAGVEGEDRFRTILPKQAAQLKALFSCAQLGVKSKNGSIAMGKARKNDGGGKIQENGHWNEKIECERPKIIFI